MTLPTSTVDRQRKQSSTALAEPTRKGVHTSGAAQRAYERRTARASLHGQNGRVTDEPGLRTAAFDASAITARIPFVALVIGLLSIGLGVTLLLTTRSAEDSYQLSDAKAHNVTLVDQKSALQRDVKLADSAPELARKAAQLGMIPANNVTRLVVAADGSSQVIGTPAPATGVPAPLLDVDTRAAATQLPSTSPATSPIRATTSVQVGSPTAAPSATPTAVNGAQTYSQGEQYVPMNTPAPTAAATPNGTGISQ